MPEQDAVIDLQPMLGIALPDACAAKQAPLSQNNNSKVDTSKPTEPKIEQAVISFDSEKSIQESPRPYLPTVFKDNGPIEAFYDSLIQTPGLEAIPIMLQGISITTLKVLISSFSQSANPEFEAFFAIQELALQLDEIIRDELVQSIESELIITEQWAQIDAGNQDPDSIQKELELKIDESRSNGTVSNLVKDRAPTYISDWLNNWRSIPLSSFTSDEQTLDFISRTNRKRLLEQTGLLTTLDMLIINEIIANSECHTPQANDIRDFCLHIGSTIPEWLLEDVSNHPYFFKLPIKKRRFISSPENLEKVKRSIKVPLQNDRELLIEYAKRGNIGMPNEALRLWKGANAVGIGMHNLASTRFNVPEEVVVVAKENIELQLLRRLIEPADREASLLKRVNGEPAFSELWDHARSLVLSHYNYLNEIPTETPTPEMIEASSPAKSLLEFIIRTIDETTSSKTAQTNQRIPPFNFSTHSKDSDSFGVNIDLLTSAFLILAREIFNPSMQPHGLLIPEVQLGEYARCDISIVDAPDYIDVDRIVEEQKEEDIVLPRTTWVEFNNIITAIENEVALHNNGDRLAVELVEIKTLLSPNKHSPTRGSLPHFRQIIKAARSLSYKYQGELPSWYKGSRLIYLSPRGPKSFFYNKELIGLHLHMEKQQKELRSHYSSI